MAVFRVERTKDYTVMMKEYPGRVTVKIDGIAASAASVIAMAGDETLMSPVSNMMIHNPATIAIGDSEEMLRTKEMLDEVKESIINAYEIKTKLPREQISQFMDESKWFNAKQAVELGFADGILYNGITNSYLSKLIPPPEPLAEPEGIEPCKLEDGLFYSLKGEKLR